MQVETELLQEYEMRLLEKEHSGCAALLQDDKVCIQLHACKTSAWHLRGAPPRAGSTTAAAALSECCLCLAIPGLCTVVLSQHISGAIHQLTAKRTADVPFELCLCSIDQLGCLKEQPQHARLPFKHPSCMAAQRQSLDSTSAVQGCYMLTRSTLVMHGRLASSPRSEFEQQ